MIDHLGGREGFRDLLSLAREVDQELHPVGLNAAVIAHNADYLLISLGRAVGIHAELADDDRYRIGAVAAHKLHGTEIPADHFFDLLRLFGYPVAAHRQTGGRYLKVISGGGDFTKAIALGPEIVRRAEHGCRNRAGFQRSITLRRSTEVDEHHVAVRIQTVFKGFDAAAHRPDRPGSTIR